MNNWKKRAGATLLALCMLLTMLPIHVLAADNVTLTVNTESVGTLSPGDAFAVPVVISNNTGFTDFNLKVTYDEQVLTFVTAAQFAADDNYDDVAMCSPTVNPANGEIAYATETAVTTDNRPLFYLRFTVNEGAASGNCEINIVEYSTGLQNNSTALNPTIVPGTVTVAGSGSGETGLTFMNGSADVKTFSLSDDITSVTEPAAREGYTFAGWFKGLVADDSVISVDTDGYYTMSASAAANNALDGYYTITGTELRPKYDTTNEGGTYDALWIEDNVETDMKKEFVDILVTTADGQTRYYISTFTSTTGENTYAKAIVSLLKTAVTDGDNGRVKLVRNLIFTVDAGSYYAPSTGFINIESGSVVLDLNGCTLGTDENFNTTSSAGRRAILPIIYLGKSYNKNTASMQIENSSSREGTVQQLSYNSIGSKAYAIYLNGGSILNMRDVTVKASSSATGSKMSCIGATAGTVESIESCKLTAYSETGTSNSFAISLDGNKPAYPPVIESINNCTIETDGTLIEIQYSKGNGHIDSITNTTMTSTGTGATAAFRSSGTGLVFGEGNTVTVGQNVIFSNFQPESGEYRGPCYLSFTSNQSTYSTSATGGKAFADEEMIISSPNGYIARDNGNGAVEFVSGYTVTFLDKDKTTLLATVQCTLGEDVTSKAPTDLEWATEGLTIFHFGGWTNDPDAMNNGTPVNLSEINTDTTLYPVYTTTQGEAVLEITKNGTTTQYTSDYDAYKIVEELCDNKDYNSLSIKLLSDVEWSCTTVVASKTVTVDLNGHTMTANNTEKWCNIGKLFLINSSGTLNIVDNSENGGGKIVGTDGGKAIVEFNYCNNPATLSIKNVSIEMPSSSAAVEGAIYSVGNGNIRISIEDTTIVNHCGAAVYVKFSSTSAVLTATISGNSVLEGTNAPALQVVPDDGSTSTVNINGGKFKGTEPLDVGSSTVNYPTNMEMSKVTDADGYYTLVYKPLAKDDRGRITGDVRGNLADGVVVIGSDLTVTEGDVATATLSKETVATFKECPGVALRIETAFGSVEFDAGAVTAIMSSEDVNYNNYVALKIEKKDVNSANTDEVARYDISLTCSEGDVIFPDHYGTVTLNFEAPADAEAGTGYVVYYAHNVIDVGEQRDLIASTVSDAESGGKCITFTTTHFSTYAIATQSTFNLTVTPTDAEADRHYNKGDTFTANIVATAPAANTAINSFQFTLSYDDTLLSVTDISSTLESLGSLVRNGDTVAFSSTGGTNPTIPAEGLTLVTVTFEVKNVTTDGTTATLSLAQTAGSALEVTQQGENSSPTPNVFGDEVTLHDITVTLNPGANGAIDGGRDSLTLYAKYNQAGLYTDNTYTTQRASVEAAAAAGYRLADSNWQDAADSSVTYADYAAIAAAAFTASAAINLQTVRTVTISFAEPAEGGTLTTMEAITVDASAVLTADQVTALNARPQAAEGYTFVKWQVVGESSNTDFNASAPITADITLIAVFSANTYNFTTAVTNATVNTIDGVENNLVTRGQNVTFTVTPNAGAAVTEVRYYVGDAATTGTVLTPDASGTYTIPGAAITGSIKVEVTTVQYVTVTFTAGTGTTLTEATAYARSGQPGLFTDTTFTALFTVPVPVAAEGYRLAADTTAEPLWTAGSNSYASAAVAQTTFTVNTTLTAQAIKQTTVTINAASVEGVESVEPATTTITVDADEPLPDGVLPTVTPAPGYEQDGWVDGDGNAFVPGTTPVPESGVTLTPKMVKATYDVTLPTGVTGVTVTAGSGLTVADVDAGTYTAAYDTDAVFTVVATAGTEITRVYYRVNGGDAVNLTAGADGETYTIPGDKITGPISVLVETVGTVEITFTAVEGGYLDSESTTTVIKTFPVDYVLTAADIPAPTAKAGYAFDKWDVNPLGQTVTAAATYTAAFKAQSYTVTWPTGFNGPVATATYGVDLTFDPVDSDGTLLSNVKYTVGDDPTEYTPTKNADGTYTIPGTAITGNITVTGTITQLDGTITFITYDQYKALATGTKIAVLKISGGTNNSTVTMSDGGKFYWSNKYGAYLHIVSDTETANSILSKLTVTGTPTPADYVIDYSGDINGSGSVTAADAGMVNDTLHGLNTGVTELERLKMDVIFNGSVSTAAVTTSDIQWILDVAVGKTTNP